MPQWAAFGRRGRAGADRSDPPDSAPTPSAWSVRDFRPPRRARLMFAEILVNAVSTGLLIGSIYAALALGLAVTFGILHIPNIAHPAFVVLGAYVAVKAN